MCAALQEGSFFPNERKRTSGSLRFVLSIATESRSKARLYPRRLFRSNGHRDRIGIRDGSFLTVSTGRRSIERTEETNIEARSLKRNQSDPSSAVAERGRQLVVYRERYRCHRHESCSLMQKRSAIESPVRITHSPNNSAVVNRASSGWRS